MQSRGDCAGSVYRRQQVVCTHVACLLHASWLALYTVIMRARGCCNLG